MATISRRGAALLLAPVPRSLCRLILNWRRLLTIIKVKRGVRKAPENVVRAVMTTFGLLSVVVVSVPCWVVSPTLLASRAMGTLVAIPEEEIAEVLDVFTVFLMLVVVLALPVFGRVRANFDITPSTALQRRLVSIRAGVISIVRQLVLIVRSTVVSVIMAPLELILFRNRCRTG